MLIGFEVHEVSEANTAEENNEEKEQKKEKISVNKKGFGVKSEL